MRGHYAAAGPGHRHERAGTVGTVGEIGAPHIPVQPGTVSLGESGDVLLRKPSPVVNGRQ